MFFTVPALLVSALTVSAASVPQARNVLEARQSIAPISTSEINSFPPYAWFASTAYCKPSSTLAWNCGTNCDNNADFIPTASGGDGRDVQFCEYFLCFLVAMYSYVRSGYVGFSPSLNSVVVAHEGTNPESLYDDFFHILTNSLHPCQSCGSHGCGILPGELGFDPFPRYSF